MFPVAAAVFAGAAVSFTAVRFFAGARVDVKFYVTPGNKNIGDARMVVNDCCELFTSRSTVIALNKEADRHSPRLSQVKFYYKVNIPQNTGFIVCSFYSGLDRKAMTAAVCSQELFRARVRDVVGMDILRVVESPRIIPFAPGVPGVLFTVFFALLSGAAVFAATLIWEYCHDVLCRSEDVKNELGITAVGVFPNVSKQLAESGVTALVADLAEQDRNNFSLIYEQFQLFLTNLRFMLPSMHRGAVTVLVTSLMSGDGKSFISSNLAHLLARNNRRVLLVGCDLRHPALHRYFNINRRTGLVNLVLGENTFEETVNRSIGGLPLDILASGPVPPEPLTVLEMFNDLNFKERYCKDYDYVIFDSAPLDKADALLFAKNADHVLLVARSGITPARLLRRANDNLRAIGLKIGGIILNCVDFEEAYFYGKYSNAASGIASSASGRRGSFLKHFFKAPSRHHRS